MKNIKPIPIGIEFYKEIIDKDYYVEIIDDNGNVIGNRVSEAGGTPSVDYFDLSTKKGFLRDFDKLGKK